MSRVVLTLDIATRTGFAVGPIGREPSSGVFECKGKETGPIMIQFETWLSRLIMSNGPSIVIYEATILPGTTQLATLTRLYGLSAVCEMVCAKQDREVRIVYAAQWKKYACGSGRQKPAEYQAAITAKGFPTVYPDEAAAIGMFAYASAILKAPMPQFSIGGLSK